MASASDISAAPDGLADRYALALLALADDKRAADAGALDRIARDITSVLTLWRDDEPFRAFIADPRIGAASQLKGALAVAERLGLGAEVRNLMGVMVNNRRLDVLPKVANAFNTLLAARQGQQAAEVTSAHPLTDTQRSQLVARLIEAGYPNVKLVEHLDPAILGGLIVKIGSRLYDNSIKSKLQRLQYAMKGAA